MSALSDSLLIIGGSTVCSLLGISAVRRTVPRRVLEDCHEVGGYLLAVVGTLYAILVGLIVVSSQGKVDMASQMAVSEADMLSNIYHLSHTFKEPTGHEIRTAIHSYAVAACDQDWTKVIAGKEREATIPAYRELWKLVVHYVPQASNDEQCYSTMLNNLEQLSNSRKYRMVAARGQLSPVLWNVLVAGGVLIILFTYFFFLENISAQMIMTAFVAVFLSMNIYLIYIFQNPYRPELGVKNAGFGEGFNVNWFVEPEIKAEQAHENKEKVPQK